MTEHMVKLKRAYEPRARSDGYRVLVERLWPRGVRKQALPLHAWAKEAAPSTALRRWFGHDPARWIEFRRRYREELADEPARSRVHELAERATMGTVTLVYASRDPEHNSAVVLRDEIERVARRIAAGAEEEQPTA
jgi:uncharacterized protein YeaO (DUF488 family)